MEQACGEDGVKKIKLPGIELLGKYIFPHCLVKENII